MIKKEVAGCIFKLQPTERREIMIDQSYYLIFKKPNLHAGAAPLLSLDDIVS